MSKVLKVSGNLIASNVNGMFGHNPSSSKTLKINILNSGNLSVRGDPSYKGFSKTLKVIGSLSDQNSLQISNRPYWSSYNSVPINYQDDPTFNMYGINNNGNIIGSTSLTELYYVPSLTSTRIPISITPYYNATIYSINDGGEIVGVCDEIPCYWSSYSDTPTPLDYTGSGGIADSINNDGHIVGMTDIDIQTDRGTPAYWETINDSVTALTLPPSLPGTICQHISINNNQHIVATLIDQNSNRHPYYWSSPTDVSPTPINTDSFGLNTCVTTGINDNEQIVGYYISDDIVIPIFWESFTASPVVMRTGSYINNFVTQSINNDGNIV